MDPSLQLLFAAGDSALDESAITKLLLAIAVLLGLARLLGELCRTLGQPAVLGEILAGIILGPTLLGWVLPDVHLYLFPHDAESAAGAAAWIAEEGFITLSAAPLLFVVGVDFGVEVVIGEVAMAMG